MRAGTEAPKLSQSKIEAASSGSMSIAFARESISISPVVIDSRKRFPMSLNAAARPGSGPR